MEKDKGILGGLYNPRGGLYVQVRVLSKTEGSMVQRASEGSNNSGSFRATRFIVSLDSKCWV